MIFTQATTTDPHQETQRNPSHFDSRHQQGCEQSYSIEMTPLSYYLQLLNQGEALQDAAQASAVDALQDLFERLNGQQITPSCHKIRPLQHLIPWRRQPNHGISPERGLYLWGGVGRGKTWLVDLFYNHIPGSRKQRLHFHQFMYQIHDELKKLKGVRNPLEQVAEKMAKTTRLLCLDEFIVTDIGDAMILAQLLKAMFERGITLVTTSNTSPDKLYQNGLQRTSFLPAIELLKQHTQVLHLDSDTDYRLRYLEQARIYHTPHTAEVEKVLEQEFDQLSPEEGKRDTYIHICNRDIPVRRIADDVVWFDFMALCGPPRSQADYLELARCFHTVLLSEIPTLGPALDDVTRRFLYLVDEFYDRNVKLIISAAKPPDHLYQGERLAFDFQRAVSRLQEMQSTAYLAQAHRA